jgi:hypothetical protein
MLQHVSNARAIIILVEKGRGGLAPTIRNTF